MALERCSYCRSHMKPGTGLTFVENSGRILHFCSSKCRRNMKLGRDPNKLLWISKNKDNK